MMDFGNGWGNEWIVLGRRKKTPSIKNSFVGQACVYDSVLPAPHAVTQKTMARVTAEGFSEVCDT